MLSYVGQMMIHHTHHTSLLFLFISVFLSFSYAIVSRSLPAHACPFSKFHLNLHPLSHTPSLIINLMSIQAEEEEVCQFIFLHRWIWGWSSGHVQKRCRKWKNRGVSVCDKKTKRKTATFPAVTVSQCQGECYKYFSMNSQFTALQWLFSCDHINKKNFHYSDLLMTYINKFQMYL